MAKVIGVDSSTQSCKVVVRDADTGRGAVAYLRYDGHYGLIRPADG